MNDEQLARHAAVALLDEAARSADTDRALGDLLRGVDPMLVPATSTVVRRSRTLWFAIAGVVAAGLISVCWSSTTATHRRGSWATPRR